MEVHNIASNIQLVLQSVTDLRVHSVTHRRIDEWCLDPLHIDEWCLDPLHIDEWCLDPLHINEQAFIDCCWCFV